MQDMLEYLLISDYSGNLVDFVTVIQDNLDKGWQLQGGICVSIGALYQALSRRQE